MNLRNLLPAVCAIAASCVTTVPERVKESDLNSPLPQEESQPTTAEVIAMIARRQALKALFPYEIAKELEAGTQKDGSFVSCEEIDMEQLEREGVNETKENIAAARCVRAAQAQCKGAITVTEKQVGAGSIHAGKVRTVCSRPDDKGGAIVGAVNCDTEIGVYSESDGAGAVACTRTDFTLNVEY